MSILQDERTPFHPLTSPNLRSTASQKLNKDRFVRKFVEDQSRYTTTYAKQGREPCASPDLNTPRKAPTPREACGFETPILKSRATGSCSHSIEARENTRHTSNQGRKLHDKPSGEPTTLSSPETPRQPVQDTILEEDVDNLPKKKISKRANKSVGKKRSASVDSDEEHQCRLAERRERRRAKRAIVGPQSSDEENQADPDTKRSRGNGREKENKVSVGLALMHGFTATNVGKNRLTLKARPSIGVFNKGKASKKISVTDKKKKVKKAKISHLFSESAFLNSNKGNTETVLSSASSSSSSTATRPKKFLITNKIVPKPSGYKQQDQPCRHNTPPPPISEGNSEATSGSGSKTWDIELQDAPLSAASSPVLEEASKGGSVVVDIRPTAWAADITNQPVHKVNFMNSNASHPCEDDLAEGKNATSRSPIGPSESASRLTSKPIAVSNYFPLPPGYNQLQPATYSVKRGDVMDVFKPEELAIDGAELSMAPLQPQLASQGNGSQAQWNPLLIPGSAYDAPLSPILPMDTVDIPQSAVGLESHHSHAIPENPTILDDMENNETYFWLDDEEYDHPSVNPQDYDRDLTFVDDQYNDGLAHGPFPSQDMTSSAHYTDECVYGYADDYWPQEQEEPLSTDMFFIGDFPECGQEDYQRSLRSDDGIYSGIGILDVPEFISEYNGYEHPCDSSSNFDDAQSYVTDANEVDPEYDLAESFTQGRALLRGVSYQSRYTSDSRAFPPDVGTVSRAEQDVVRHLRSHWLPQKL